MFSIVLVLVQRKAWLFVLWLVFSTVIHNDGRIPAIIGRKSWPLLRPSGHTENCSRTLFTVFFRIYFFFYQLHDCGCVNMKEYAEFDQLHDWRTSQFNPHIRHSSHRWICAPLTRNFWLRGHLCAFMLALKSTSAWFKAASDIWWQHDANTAVSC